MQLKELFNKSSKELQGELFLFSSALIWSLFPIVTQLSYQTLSPFASAAFCNLFAAIFFAIVISFRKQWWQIKQKLKLAWPSILLATIFNGILYYTFCFLGLKYSSAGNASIVLTMEAVASLIILRLWGKEKLSKFQITGSLLMSFGAILVLLKGSFVLHLGDFYLVLATIFPPFGNYFIQRARIHISSSMIMCTRSILSSIFFAVWVYLFEKDFRLEQANPILLLLIFNGFIVFGFCKILWVEAIHRISISKAISLSSIGPGFTLLFAYLILGEIPSYWQVAGLLPIMLGVQMLVRKKE